ncbi:MAG: hypothetical protein IT335_09460 [Thermomicrobiales bacterium]|nr:hypothetical protein [Thermomicrobiales bacterium]
MAGRVVKLMIRKGLKVEGSRVLVLGITFKENCPDVRNSKAIDIIRELQDFGCLVSVADPWADAEEVRREYDLPLTDAAGSYEAIVLAVAHREYRDLDVKRHLAAQGVLFDVKGVLPRQIVDDRL